MSARPLAVITGASSGIGRELAMLCAQNTFDLIVAADDPAIAEAGDTFREAGAAVEVIETDLAALEGVDELYDTIAGRRVDALLANAGHGLGHAFLDQDFEDVMHVIDTNITGTTYLVHKVGRDMRARRSHPDEKDDPGDVARAGFDAMIRGDADVVSGWKNKMTATIANVTPSEVLAEQHRKMAEPGSAHKSSSKPR